MHNKAGDVHHGVAQQLGDHLLHHPVGRDLHVVLPHQFLFLLLFLRDGMSAVRVAAAAAAAAGLSPEQLLSVVLQRLLHQVPGDLIRDVLRVSVEAEREGRGGLGQVALD